MPGLAFPAITGAYALNPFCYIQEPADAFGTKITASPSYTAVALAENVEITIDNVPLNIMQAGSFFSYSRRTGGQNFPFHVDVSPLNINFLKIGTNAPDLTTPSGTAAASYQFLMKYRQSYGTASLVDTYLFLLGCRPKTTTITVTPQQKVTVGMDWVARELQISSAVNGGLTTPTIPTNASITGPVIIDADAATNTPLTINSLAYPTNGFTLAVDTGLITQPYNGSGLIDVSAPGFNNTTGNFSIPVGAQGTALETIALANQTGVPIDYVYKAGAMVAHVTGAILTSGSRSFPGQVTSIMENPFSFEAATTTFATS